MSHKERLRPEVGQVALWSVVRAENHGLALASMPKAALSARSDAKQPGIPIEASR
jgi:hypothetical protein